MTDLHRLLIEAVHAGVRHLFILWLDGCDWQTTQAAAILRSGRVYREGRGSGLLFQDYSADGTTQYGYAVTSPSHQSVRASIENQSVNEIIQTGLCGGYDPDTAGLRPWDGSCRAQLAYCKGHQASPAEQQLITDTGCMLHAVTDSAASASALASGAKVFNDSLNIDARGNVLEPLFVTLQAQGWQVGTVTSVPFNHASPAAMYARNVSRNDYHDLARQMLGLGGRIQQLGKATPVPGLDLVLGTGFVEDIHRHGAPYLAYRDRLAADAANGGRYVIVETAFGMSGREQLQLATDRALREQRPLFGCFGMAGLEHLPYQTADRRYNPALGLNHHSESYDASTLYEQPTLTELTTSALSLFGADKAKKPFALFVEAGDIDWALHDNNLDNAVGAVYSGEEAFRSIVRWVETHSDWQESAVLVSADHGHLLNIHDPQQLAAMTQMLPD
jgi:alkaline phosphatase